MQQRFTILISFFLIIIGLTNHTFGSPNKLSSFRIDSVDIYNAPFKLAPLKAEQEPFFTQSVLSPNETIELNVTVSTDKISYSINKDNIEIISQSGLDIALTTGNLIKGLTLENYLIDETSEILTLPSGEKNEVLNHYIELILNFKNASNLKFDLIFRIYDYGVGFRYHYPENNATSEIRLNNEYTQFNLNHQYTAWRETYNERGYTPSPVNDLQSLIPLTLTSDNFALVINEAGNDGYARIALQGTGNVLQSYFIGSTRNHTLPFQTPWRYVQIAENPGGLIANKMMLYGLNNNDYDPSAYNWVKPGTVFRCVTLTTEGALEAIDFCHDLNIDYMMFDAGWYGLGYGQSNENNPASDPMNVIDEIDMPTVSGYAREKKVGIILYINKVAWYNYDNQAMFDLYESWGIKGLKLGFMDGYSANGIKKIYDIITEAGQRKMVVNVHDNFRPTGMIRKYPNLLTAEGVRGNEYTSTHSGNHTTLIPFTRMLTGATDYTICYKESEVDYPSKLITTRGHQLALSVVNFSPLQHIMWYGHPANYKVPLEIELFSFLPVTWDNSRLTAGRMGEFVSYARKKDDKWFLGTLNNSLAKDVVIPIDFLEPNKNYEVTIYRDKAPATIEKIISNLDELKENGTVTSDELSMSLDDNGGEVVIFTELGDATAVNISKKYEQDLSLFPNPADNFVWFHSNLLSGTEVIAKIYSLKGRKMLSKKLIVEFAGTKLNVSNLPNGSYIFVIENENIKMNKVLVVEH